MKPMDWDSLSNIFSKMEIPLLIEANLFNMAGRFSESYNGGLWTVEQVGEFSVVVPPAGEYNVSVEGNYYSGVMDALTFGAALTLLMYNNLLWRAYEKGMNTEELSERFYAMRDSVLDDNRFNGSAVLGFLD